MCYYRTYKNGTLVTPNVEPEKVELLYKIKTFVSFFDAPNLSRFIVEAENKLFQAEGRNFRKWLEGMNPDGVNEVLDFFEELQRSRDEHERRHKEYVVQLLKEFLTP